MQANKKTSRFCHRPLIAALATLAGAAAWADEPSPWYLGVSQALTHDSNVYRVPDGVGDNYSSTGLLGGFDQPIGRQRLHGSANIRYNKYQDETTLDNTSYGVAAGWDWETIEKMQARVEYDLEYLRNWSLGLDLQIIVRTIRLVFFDRHAY